MSSSRQRNIYTLGSKEKPKRRQPADPFERDPFKINSYNFRYADRPTFQLPVLQQRTNNQAFLKDCQTYFYNYNFPSINDSKTARNAALQNDNIQLNLTKFQEYRRRKFLTGTKENSLNLNQLSNKSKLLLSDCDKGNDNISQAFLKKKTLSQLPNSNNSLTNNYSQSFVRNIIKPESARRSLTALPTGSISADRIRSLGSGCEISIDIKSLKNRSLHENVNIKIKTDSVSRNLNIPLTKTLKHSNETRGRTEQLKSSDAFVIDKRLSKFLSNQDRQDNYIKELTAAYSSQRLIRSPKVGHLNSTERLPSLIPFGSRDSRQNFNSSFPKENFNNKKSLLQRVNGNLSIYDNKEAGKSSSHNNLNRNRYNLGSAEKKVLSSSSLTAKQSYLNKLHKQNQASGVSSKHSMPLSSKGIDSRPTAPTLLHSNVRLPLNVTINVITDRLKLLKV